MSRRSRRPKSVRTFSRWTTAVIAASVFGCGLVWQNANLLGLAAAILCLLLRRWGAGNAPAKSGERQRDHSKREDANQSTPTNDRITALGSAKRNAAPQTTDALVDRLLANGRYALLLRPATKQHLTQSQVIRAIRQLDEAMALVPEGRVLVGQLAEQTNSACGRADLDPNLVLRNLVHLPPVYLDRFCVTNADYQRFIDDGGYEQLEFWHEEVLPALLDFVDQSGVPGPRYWSDGQYPSDEQRSPVVGISWYEACAYARWIGKRLPSDAEWTKAAAWPVESGPGRIAQRRYPWGESFDVRRAHLYSSGTRAPVPVDEFPSGTSVGGIHQLIGNVWEWTATLLTEVVDPALQVSESIMSIRGGAFDTYFENQATCHFQSGEHALSRRRNIGLRLALPISDLEAPREADAPMRSDSEEPRELSTEFVLATD